MADEPTAIDVLAPFDTWQLNRVSPRTFPNDVICTVKRKGQPVSADEQTAIADLVRGGSCYRCRIGHGRYFFGRTALAAAQAAAAAAAKGDRTD